MNTVNPLITLGMMLTVISMGVASVVLFKFIPNRMDTQQSRIVQQFILYFAFGAMAFVAFLVLPSWIPREVTIVVNSLFYVAAIYFLRQGLLLRRNETVKKLSANPVFYVNMVGIALFQYIGFTQLPDLTPARVALFNCNIILVFMFCLQLVSNKRSGEIVVRYAIYFSIFFIVCISATLFFDPLYDFYPMFVMALQALMFLIWLGALFGLLLADSIQTHYANSMTDAMTGLHNRRYFMQKSARVLKTLKADNMGKQPHDLTASLIICDIDHFKQINDKYGHSVGDKVICHFAKVLQTVTRRGDLLARIGGEEFAIFLPEVSQERAIAIANSICQLTQAKPLDEITYTASFGVTTTHIKRNTHIDDFLKPADHAMYDAKRAGRNRVCASTF